MNDADLDRRLAADAARWNAARPGPPDLQQLVRVACTPDAPVHGRRRWIAPLLATAAVLIVAGAAGFAVRPNRSPGPSASGGLRTCGPAPVSSGVDVSHLVLTMVAPARAKSGTTVNPSVRLSAAGATVELTDGGLPVDVVIVKQGEIVGAYDGSVGGTGLQASVTRQGMTVPSLPVLLSGCPSGAIDFGHPDASRRPLPAGDYQLVAVLDVDHYGSAPERLVSAPTTIAVTG